MNTLKQNLDRTSVAPFSHINDFARISKSATNAGGVGAFDESIDSDLESRLNKLMNSANPGSANSNSNETGNDEGQELSGTDPFQISDLDRFLANESLTQLAVHSTNENSETIVHYSRCQFEPGQTRYVLHIPFFPTLANKPTIDANVIEFDARVRVTDCQRFGARIEIIANDSSDHPAIAVVETTIHRQD